MKQFVTEESFWELFPEAQIGIVVAHNMKPTAEVAPADAAAIARALAEANGKADQHLESNTISQNEVVAVWREAYQKFKTKKGARCSIENLLKRVLKGNPVGSITPSVDIYNTVSLTHALPVGGEDIDAMDGDIRLGITEGGDAFRPLGEEENAPTLEGELCYRDDAGAICRCWNWRDGERTALTDDSKKAFLIIESVDPDRADDLAAATDQLAAMVQQYLGADIFAKQIIARDNPTMVIDEQRECAEKRRRGVRTAWVVAAPRPIGKGEAGELARAHCIGVHGIGVGRCLGEVGGLHPHRPHHRVCRGPGAFYAGAFLRCEDAADGHCLCRVGGHRRGPHGHLRHGHGFGARKPRPHPAHRRPRRLRHRPQTRRRRN